MPTAPYIVEMARLFHTSTDYILGLEQQEQVVLRNMNQEEKNLVYNLVEYITKNKEND